MNPSSKFVFQEANVSVVFYSGMETWKAKLFTILTLTKLHHCGIIFTIGEESILLMCAKTHRAKFLDADKFHERFFKPSHTLDMGKVHISIAQLTNFLSTPYLGDVRSLFMWHFITKHLTHSLQPKTCALLVTYILRLCGFQISDCVSPKQLYRELQKICS